jgi:hypothetical protein
MDSLFQKLLNHLIESIEFCPQSPQSFSVLLNLYILRRILRYSNHTIDLLDQTTKTFIENHDH